MPIKVQQFAQVQGMNQDLSPSKRTDKLAYEIKNMRISIEDGNTLLSWTNEKGTKSIVAPIPNGKALGTCTVNNELIIFIKGQEYDYIYGVYNLEQSPQAVCYYKGNLDLREDKKIETLAIIENSKLHKVYWIDGVHQPRFINIANKEVKECGAVYSSDNTQFDFLPTDNLFKQEVSFDDGTVVQVEKTLNVNIEKIYQTGLFKAGTVQYAFSYYNLNGAQTNLVYISPIQYVSLEKIGGETDESVNCAFKIKCSFVNKDFDYLRIYSISRTSTDTTPQARIVTDIPTRNIIYEDVEYSQGNKEKTDYSDIKYKLDYNQESQDSPRTVYEYRSQSIDTIYVYSNLSEGTANEFREKKLLIDCLQDNTVTLQAGDIIRDANNTYVPERYGDLLVIQVQMEDEQDNDSDYIIKINCQNATRNVRRFNHYTETVVGVFGEIEKKVIHVPTLEFIDNGILGTAFDYNALLFMNNSPMHPSTFDQKDNTLFLGNLKYSSNKDLDIKNAIEENKIKAKDLIIFDKVPLLQDRGNQYYPYTNQNKFSADKIMGFKGGEGYVFGFMVQDMYDRWSSIIAFKDEITNVLYPEVIETVENGEKKYSTRIIQAHINDTVDKSGTSPYQRLVGILNEIDTFKAIKFVIVSKNQAQRNVVCQGILAPTVFSEEDRIGHDIPFAQSSWFFRPIMRHNPRYYNSEIQEHYPDNSQIIEFRQYACVRNEVQSHNPISFIHGTYQEETCGYNNYIYESSKKAEGHTRYGVDTQILTMHSPDIEFDSAVQKLLEDNEVLKFRIAGYTKVHATYSDADVQLERNRFFYEEGSTPKIGSISLGNYKQINSYNQKFPAAGLSSYFGAKGRSFVVPAATGKDGEKHNSWEGYYKIFPWHRSTSINSQPTPVVQTMGEGEEPNNTIDESYWQFPLKEKKMSNVRVCCKTLLGGKYIWRPTNSAEQDSEKTGISSIGMWYTTSKLLKLRDATEPWSNELTYEGAVDTVLNIAPEDNDMNGYSLNIYDNNKIPSDLYETNCTSIGMSKDLIRMKYKSSPHAVFSLNFNRYSDRAYNSESVQKYQQWILPSIKGGDPDMIPVTSKGVSWDNTLSVMPQKTNVYFEFTVCDVSRDGDAFNYNLNTEEGRLAASKALMQRLGIVRHDYERTITEPDGSTHIYEKGYTINFSVLLITNWETTSSGESIATYVLLEYQREYILDDSYDYYNLSCTRDIEEARVSYFEPGKHISYNGSYYIIIDEGKVKLLTQEEEESSKESVGDKIYTKKDYTVDGEDDGIFYIGELYQNIPLSTTDHELESYSWQAASDTISLKETNIPNLYGDTYFQRYDCLKTYSYAPDDPNQIVDIGSFMLETRINMDGRYDRNRGLISNLNITEQNFNLINKAYTQNDYFVNSYVDNSNLDVNEYPNTVTWSLTKVYGEPIDNWTHLTSTNNLDLDGDRGTLTKIINFQDTLLFFQTEGAGLIKYNENVALAATNELPVELANSGKVDGKLYLNRIIGCQNKDTIVITTNALYFIDGNTNSIYQVTSAQGLVSPQSVTANSFEGYMKAQDLTTAKGFYNKDKQEIYYIFDNDKAPCITYNETSKTFTSFYDYKPDFFECIGETAYHLINKPSIINIINKDTQLVMDPYIEIWAQNKGDYNKFYGEVKPFYFTISANGQDGITDKIWNNIEFRADTYEQGLLQPDTTFNELNVWNEHQVGTANLTLYGHQNSINSPSSLKRKFRIWRANIPRASFVPETLFIDGINDTVEHSIQRGIPDKGQGRNRIRNPWTFIQLKNSNPQNYKTTLHDLMVYYFE